ncbi:MAG: hypothetical protein WDM79_07230 [Terricaulis sp.]
MDSKFNSADYWEKRYAKGRNSGAGSYDNLAAFKAEVLNDFVAANAIETVVEFGCGDGNQLKLAQYPRYLGVDVSPTIIALCRRLFAEDITKSFVEVSEYSGTRAELSLSLDVIYHLVEDQVFDTYMRTLFAAGTRFVIIYSSNMERTPSKLEHVRHRKFTDWIERNERGFTLKQQIENRYPPRADAQAPGNTEYSYCDFFIYEAT